ncbi:hypothetical protein AHF37_09281 [Paragonimus kellicotti]|nr:hypothetical protein AHF37_09281 [Paragonimus kellicotti]
MGLNPLGFEDGKRFSAGFLAGFMVRFLTQPFDVLKIRFQVGFPIACRHVLKLQVEPIKRRSGSYYRSLPQAFERILKEEGLTAFWKGHVPGQLLSMTFCGVEFAVFYGLSALPSTELQDNQSHSAHRDLLYGVAAGTVATTCCQPLDVMRTRLVAQGRHKVCTICPTCADLITKPGFRNVPGDFKVRGLTCSSLIGELFLSITVT